MSTPDAGKAKARERETRRKELMRQLNDVLNNLNDLEFDPGTLNDIEDESDAFAEAIRRSVAERLLRKKQERHDSRSAFCSCGKQARFVAERSRQIVMRSGEHHLARFYFHCSACRKGFSILDQALGLMAGSVSERVAELVTRYSTVLTDRQVVCELAEMHHITLATSTVQRIRQEAGQAIIAKEQYEQLLWQASRLSESQEHPQRVEVSFDGVMLHVDGQWREAKVGSAYEPKGECGALRARYRATLAPSAEFGRLLPLLAHDAGSDHCSHVAVVADGASWIWQETGKYFPDKVQILDFYHAMEHVYEVSNARHGEGSAQSHAWAAQIKGMLLAGKPEEAIESIAAWRPASAPRRKLRKNLLIYFTTHMHRMRYDTFKETGYHIGSGVIEAANKNIVQMRMKRAGMRWGREGAESMLHLLARKASYAPPIDRMVA